MPPINTKPKYSFVNRELVILLLIFVCLIRSSFGSALKASSTNASCTTAVFGQSAQPTIDMTCSTHRRNELLDKKMSSLTSRGGGWELWVIFMVLLGLANGAYQCARRFGWCRMLDPCDAAVADYCQSLAGLDSAGLRVGATELVRRRVLLLAASIAV